MAANAKNVFPSERVVSLADVGFGEDRWGVGVSGVVAEPSPFARINRLRDWYLDASPWTVDAGRAVLVTEAYQCNEHDPQPIKVSKALAHVLRNGTLGIVDGQLLVGDAAAPPKACPIFPEFSFGWIIKELKEFPIRQRPNNRYDYDGRTEATLLGLADYWQGKTLSDAMIGRMSPEEIKGDFMGIMLYSTSLYHVAGVGHLVPDFERILRLGWRGLREQVKAKLDAIEPEGHGDPAKRAFYRAQLITLDAATDYIRRYSSLAREQAASAEGARRDELQRVAVNCDWIAENPPRNFWEALQLVQKS